MAFVFNVLISSSVSSLVFLAAPYSVFLGANIPRMGGGGQVQNTDNDERLFYKIYTFLIS